MSIAYLLETVSLSSAVSTAAAAAALHCWLNMDASQLEWASE
jgi:hypothetical protein